jgi:hypothetical protein
VRFPQLANPIEWEEVDRAVLALGNKAVSLDLIKDSLLKAYFSSHVDRKRLAGKLIQLVYEGSTSLHFASRVVLLPKSQDPRTLSDPLNVRSIMISSRFGR